jgi:sugar O-acyltransferase (sialic acid O-acetyltransferase NeuD family)
MESVVIIGAGGNAKKIVDIFAQTQVHIEGYISSEKEGPIIYGFSVLGKIEDIEELKRVHTIEKAIVSIGDNFMRKQIAENLQKHDIKLVSAIHPSAIISPTVKIGAGNIIMAGAVIHADTVIGDCCLIDTSAIVEHDCTVGSFSSIAPGAVLCGNVSVDEVSAVGAGTTVLEKRTIGKQCVVGAGALVNKPIPDYSVAYGLPAAVIRKRKEGDVYLI